MFGLSRQVFSHCWRMELLIFQTSTDLVKDEFYLPAAVDNWISNGQAVFHSQLASCQWMGITYREDKPVVVNTIKEMIAKGEYPASLF